MASTEALVIRVQGIHLRTNTISYRGVLQYRTAAAVVGISTYYRLLVYACTRQ